MKSFIVITFALALTLLGIGGINGEPPVGNKRPLVFNTWPKGRSQAVQQAVAAPGKQRTLVVQIRSDQPVPLVLKNRPGAQHQHQHQHQLHSHPHPHSHSHHTHQHLQHLHQLGSHPLHTHVLPHPHTHAHLHAHTHLLHSPPPQHLRATRPIYLKGGSGVSSATVAAAARKPLKLKLSNVKPKPSLVKPSFGYDKPFKYEKPSAPAYSELQNLPLGSHANFITDHFAPIYTVPAPNLALHDNQLHDDIASDIGSVYLPPTSPQSPSSSSSSNPSTVRPQTYLPPPAAASGTQYSVHEDETNDQTIRDPISGSQKLFAPDPDPSLPTSKIRPSTEIFNTPSNNKPLPVDVHHHHQQQQQQQLQAAPAQPIVQINGAQAAAQTVPEIYPIQLAQQAHLQPFIAAVPAAHIPIYNPTYLVTQSNQLYSQHKQQLFKPSAEHVIETGYVNADLTQEVASNGQILQAAKDPHHDIHPVLDAAPQFAALIAAPSLGEETAIYETAPFHLPNVASAVTSGAPESGFVVSNYYGNAHDSSQLLQAYAEEEAHRQQLETEHAALELQKQHQLHLEDLKAQAEAQELQQQQQQQQHLEQLKLQAQEQHYQQQQQQQHLQLLQLQQQHQQQQQQQQEQQHVQYHPPVTQDPASVAFEEHSRLVQQQLGTNTPLRIFVPDEDPTSESRLQKRSDDVKKGTVEDVHSLRNGNDNSKDLFEVSTSVEVSG